MTIDATCPNGLDARRHFVGACRDLRTGDSLSDWEILAEDRLTAGVDQCTILEAQSVPPRPDLAKLPRIRAGGKMRGMINTILPEEKANATPLYLLLDDMVGATLVSLWGIAQWEISDDTKLGEWMGRFMPDMSGVCIGLRPGTTALNVNGRAVRAQNYSWVEPLGHSDDPQAWHEFGTFAAAHFRRARRIDAWIEGDRIVVDASFQDSAAKPEGGRVAIHEYHLRAVVETRNGILAELNVVPSTLPYKECAAAPVNVPALLGTPVSEMREAVTKVLFKTHGCTHLNDMLRSLAEVPTLVRKLVDVEVFRGGAGGGAAT